MRVVRRAARPAIVAIACLAVPLDAEQATPAPANLPPVLRTVPAIDPISVPPRPSVVHPHGPIPRMSPSNWVRYFDYPPIMQLIEAEGETVFSLTIGEDGKVGACRITSSSGWALLDERACSLMTRRARFIPATDSEGYFIVGFFNSRVRWQMPSDIERELPRGRDTGSSRVIGVDGRATDCRVWGPATEANGHVEARVEAPVPVACDEEDRWEPHIGRSGAPTRLRVTSRVLVTIEDVQ